MDIYSGNVVMELPVAVIDNDNSSLSRTLIKFLDATREIKITQKGISLQQDAENMLLKGSVTAVLIIPDSFSSNIKKGKVSSPLIAIDGSNILTGKTVLRAVQKVAGTISAGITLNIVKKMGGRKESALAIVQPLTISDSVPFNPAANYSVYMAPGLAFFFLHVFILIMAASLFVPYEKPASFLAWIGASSAIFLHSFVAGMIFFYLFLPYASIFSASSFLITVSMLSIFIVLDILFAFMIGVLSFLNWMSGIQLSILFGMLSLMFSGITWPTDMFPSFFRQISFLIPFTFFAKGMRIFLHYPADFSMLSVVLIPMMKQLSIYISVIELCAIGFIISGKRRRANP